MTQSSSGWQLRPLVGINKIQKIASESIKGEIYGY